MEGYINTLQPLRDCGNQHYGNDNKTSLENKLRNPSWTFQDAEDQWSIGNVKGLPFVKAYTSDYQYNNNQAFLVHDKDMSTWFFDQGEYDMFSYPDDNTSIVMNEFEGGWGMRRSMNHFPFKDFGMEVF